MERERGIERKEEQTKKIIIKLWSVSSGQRRKKKRKEINVSFAVRARARALFTASSVQHPNYTSNRIILTQRVVSVMLHFQNEENKRKKKNENNEKIKKLETKPVNFPHK